MRSISLALLIMSAPLQADPVPFPELLQGSESRPILEPGQSSGQPGALQKNAEQNAQQRQLMQNSSDYRGAINPQTGQFYPKSGRGVVNPQTGEVYPKSGKGFINPGTQEYYPAQ